MRRTPTAPSSASTSHSQLRAAQRTSQVEEEKEHKATVDNQIKGLLREKLLELKSCVTDIKEDNWQFEYKRASETTNPTVSRQW
jgi:hypothetical protein